VHHRRSPLLSLVLLMTAATWLPAQEPAPSELTAEELIAREQLRLTVEQALDLYSQPTESGEMKNDNFIRAADELVAAGPGVVPFLALELQQDLPDTHHFCAYALGRIGTREAMTALRASLERSLEQGGDFARSRQGWSAYGLALAGVDEAVDLLYAGDWPTGRMRMHSGMTMVEVVALHTAPQCVPRLIALLGRASEDEAFAPERTILLRAMWRVADTALAPTLLEVSRESKFRPRREAVRGLAYIDLPEARRAVVEAFGDEEVTVRQLALTSLESAEMPVDLNVLVKRLKIETAPGTRNVLYRLLADRGGAKMIPTLREHWDRPDPLDRMGIVGAMELIGTSAVLPLLQEALVDRDSRVRINAVEAAGAVGDDKAVELLLLSLLSNDWPMVQTAAETLVELRADKAGAAIAERLLKMELKGVMREAAYRYRAEALANDLVELRHHQALEGLIEATARQIDPMLIANLQRVIDALQLIRDLGEDRARWIDAAASDDPRVRSLAYARLGEIGGDESTRALARLFGRVEPAEGVQILRALGDSGGDKAQELFERVLTSPAFDTADRWVLRDEAAWGARRLGGERMLAALERAVERRDGRDARVLAYLALADGKRALPLLKRFRVVRMRYPTWYVSDETATLDRIARRIEVGRSLDRFDLPPDKLRMH
jgi:HEAT repeat protein